MKSFFIIFLGLLVASQASILPRGRSPRAMEGRIVGGEEAEPNSVPYVALMRAGGRVYCGGSVLDEHHVLTAAHCVDIDEIVAGEHRPNVDEGPEQVRRVKEIIPHPDYDLHGLFDGRYDVAVLVLEEPLQFDDNVQPVKLPSSETEFEVGSDGRVCGWGRLGANDDIPDALNCVVVQFIDDQDCADYFPFPVDADIMICAGVPGQGTCFGDSGSSIVSDGMVAGVVSWGSSRCSEDGPTVYTRITAFADWIEETVAST